MRRLTAALCAGLAVWCALEAVLSTIATAPMAVAAQTIERGAVIRADDVQIISAPQSLIGPSILTQVEQVTGKVAQITIEVNDPISTHMARDAPLAPTGTTVIEVRLASNPEELLAGDRVRLVSAVGCEGEECTLTDDALVMGAHISDSEDYGYGSASSNGNVLSQGVQTVSFAMDPQAAARVMALQEAGAIMAVMR
ncbi:SAF domain-containing protein [Bifidobacterium oedipodis]|uniref:SAF domain-containing protein n=1 Tax=Bifidobacterium oedipodis TaxID=2675322 RepID=UPI001F1021CF|nr:SAF domain-containing protein [Bifidobacterium sp. DSM 109957]